MSQTNASLLQRRQAAIARGVSQIHPIIAARDKGLILLSCGTYYNVIRFLMPITIPDAQLDQGLAILAECFDELA